MYCVPRTKRVAIDAIALSAITVCCAHACRVPDDLVYGETTGEFGYVKTDHCQFIDPVAVISQIRNATDSALPCRKDLDAKFEFSKKFHAVIHPPRRCFPSRVPPPLHPPCLAACASSSSVGGLLWHDTADVLQRGADQHPGTHH